MVHKIAQRFWTRIARPKGEERSDESNPVTPRLEPTHGSQNRAAILDARSAPEGRGAKRRVKSSHVSTPHQRSTHPRSTKSHTDLDARSTPEGRGAKRRIKSSHVSTPTNGQPTHRSLHLTPILDRAQHARRVRSEATSQSSYVSIKDAFAAAHRRTRNERKQQRTEHQRTLLATSSLAPPKPRPAPLGGNAETPTLSARLFARRVADAGAARSSKLAR